MAAIEKARKLEAQIRTVRDEIDQRLHEYMDLEAEMRADWEDFNLRLDRMMDQNTMNQNMEALLRFFRQEDNRKLDQNMEARIRAAREKNNRKTGQFLNRNLEAQAETRALLEKTNLELDECMEYLQHMNSTHGKALDVDDVSPAFLNCVQRQATNDTDDSDEGSEDVEGDDSEDELEEEDGDDSEAELEQEDEDDSEDEFEQEDDDDDSDDADDDPRGKVEGIAKRKRSGKDDSVADDGEEDDMRPSKI